MTSKEYAVTAQLGTCFLCLISHFLPMLPIGHFQQRPEYKGGWWAWHIGQPPGQSTTGWEWIPGANERSEVLFPSSFSVTVLNVNRLLKVQDRWTFSTWKRSKSDRQTNPKQVNRGKSEGVDYVVKKNFKKEFRGHMEQTKNQNRHSKINYVIPKICQKGKSDNMKEILETKSVIGQNVPLYLFGLL